MTAKLIQAQIEAALKDMLTFFGRPRRDEWMNEPAWKEAKQVCANAEAVLTAAAEARGKYTDGDPLVTELIWEVDRAVKQAEANGGKYETVIRHILNKHLTAAAEVGGPSKMFAYIDENEKLRAELAATIERCAQVAEEYDGPSGKHGIAAAIRALKNEP